MVSSPGVATRSTRFWLEKLWLPSRTRHLHRLLEAQWRGAHTACLSCLQRTAACTERACSCVLVRVDDSVLPPSAKRLQLPAATCSGKRQSIVTRSCLPLPTFAWCLMLLCVASCCCLLLPAVACCCLLPPLAPAACGHYHLPNRMSAATTSTTTCGTWDEGRKRLWQSAPYRKPHPSRFCHMSPRCRSRAGTGRDQPKSVSSSYHLRRFMRRSSSAREERMPGLPHHNSIPVKTPGTLVKANPPWPRPTSPIGASTRLLVSGGLSADREKHGGSTHDSSSHMWSARGSGVCAFGVASGLNFKRERLVRQTDRRTDRQ